MSSKRLPGQRDMHRAQGMLRVLVVLAFATLTGCGGSEFEMADVQGTVIIDGRPFAHGTVMFAPVAGGTSQNSGRPAFGPLKENGRFELNTGGKKGAVVGEHWVTIFAVADPNNSSASRPSFERVAVPKRIQVEPGKQNVVEIKLSAQDVAKYGR
jgi:hypothetical protein